MPMTCAPASAAQIVAAPITLLMPGAGPPPHKMPNRGTSFGPVRPFVFESLIRPILDCYAVAGYFITGTSLRVAGASLITPGASWAERLARLQPRHSASGAA